MKYFRMSYEEVVFKRSYLNLMLLNRAIPGFKPLDKEERGEVDANPTRTRKSGVTRKKAGTMHANKFFEQFM